MDRLTLNAASTRPCRRRSRGSDGLLVRPPRRGEKELSAVLVRTNRKQVANQEHFVLNREDQLANAIRLNRLDEHKRTEYLDKLEADMQKSMRQKAVKEHFKSQRVAATLDNKERRKKLQAQFADKQMKAIKAVFTRPVTPPSSESESSDSEYDADFHEHHHHEDHSHKDRPPLTIDRFVDAETGEEMQLNTKVYDFEERPPDTRKPKAEKYSTVGMYTPFELESKRNATQSDRMLGEHVGWEEGMIVRAEQKYIAETHTLKRLEEHLEFSCISEMEKNVTKAEIVDKLKHVHNEFLSVLLEEEKDLEVQRNVDIIMNREKVARLRLLNVHTRQRDKFRVRYKRVKEECEMLLAQKLVDYGFLK
jgi:hypothetical protein